MRPCMEIKLAGSHKLPPFGLFRKHDDREATLDAEISPHVDERQRISPRTLPSEGAAFTPSRLPTGSQASLCSADALDLSSAQSAFVQLPSGRSKIRYQRNNDGRSDRHAPFPDKTVGFLYFHAPSCSLRFRIVPSCLPRDFDAGHDLCAHDGAVTWGKRAASLARGRQSEALRQQLLNEGLIDLPALQSRARTTTTLRHEEISDRDLLDLSDCNRNVGVWLVRPDGTSIRLYICYGQRKGVKKFPSGTRGFLYYHAPSNPYDGAIRLRLAERAAEFDDASDLRHPVLETVWGVALEHIATTRDTARTQREELLDYLVQKKFVTAEIVRHMRMARSVDQLRDAFFVNFRMTRTTIELRGHDGSRALLRFKDAFRVANSPKPAYEGAALAHLVILGTTDTLINVGIRVQKLLHGPRRLPEEEADGHPVFLPSEGAIVLRYRRGRPVTTRVEKDSAAGRILLQMMEQEGGDERTGAQ
ncbi:hypothetical protein GGG16DRAFT_128759 [Schizophyllum commune]